MTTGPAGGFAATGISNHPGHSDQKSHGRKGGAAGQDALDAIPVGLEGLTARELDSVSRYVAPTGHYGEVNRGLRSGDGPQSPVARQTVADLDGVMARSATTADIAVHRGMRTGRGVFGDRLNGDLTGLEWEERGFSSTTARESMAKQFATDGSGPPGVVMRVSVPSGTGALKVAKNAANSEGEVILERGLKMRVTADHGIDSTTGVRLLDVEVIPT